MKHVVSISLGSSERDHAVETEILGEKFLIERRGTDGDINKAIQLFKEMDGKVDAFGLGGIDLYIYAGQKRYTFRDAEKIIRHIRHTPVVDGSGLKNTLERKVVHYLAQEYGYDLKGKKVLMVCAVDRFGMAEALIEEGSDVTFGDMIFALGIPVPLKSIKSLNRLARVLCPVITKLPFKMLYPTGNRQKEESQERFNSFYEEADIIAGDFHYIRKYLPKDIHGKLILTNTVTSRDVEMLKSRGAWMLVTTTPNLNGRSFGTNVMEAVLVSLSDKKPAELTPADYDRLLDQIGFVPRIEILNPVQESQTIVL
ncbi:quinate 5-dehydrogenase [Anoxybacter fermentans]|uniref:Quinate 5-dehydrogenase n=2 Tax=Bacteria TaxID=2 RepID=A0A3Q9HSB9_9FIRM|nr:quinate 5-dehydrogenase [Anoxybacter fermentans]AZR74673.1 quinate 5-dehydrogenase [Anoxybacter fermentans]